MNKDGTNKKNISNTPWYEKMPIYSPDGTNIIYQSWKNSNMEIYFTHLMEGNQVNISNSKGDDVIHKGNPFMRDGKEIVSMDVLKPDKTELTISDDEEFDHELHKDLREIDRINELRDLHQALS